MDEQNSIKQPCSCSKHLAEANMPVVRPAAKPLKYFSDTMKALGSFLLSLLIAFFPKCPVCWAVYMSMFSGLGIAQLPYLKWMLPVLLLLFALNLYLLYRKANKTGYGPFFITLTGAIIILLGRNFFPAEKELLYTGMLLVLSGSLWSSFSGIRFKMVSKQTA